MNKCGLFLPRFGAAPPLVVFPGPIAQVLWFPTHAYNYSRFFSYRYELIPPDLRSAALRRFVAEQAAVPPGDNGGGLERGDLIRPIGAVLKFIHCDHAEDKTGPKFEASFEVRRRMEREKKEASSERI